MKLKLAGQVCVFVVLMMCGLKAMAQPYRQLTADDYQGAPNRYSNAIAYTNCTIDFRYQAYRHNGSYQLNFDIRLIMNHYKSWMDKQRITSQQMLTEVLKHEQGHYIIAYLEQQELMRIVNRTRFGYDYQARAAEIFNQVDAQYKQLNHDYDEDTAHMLNRVQQSSWDTWFRKKLEYMPPADENASR